MDDDYVLIPVDSEEGQLVDQTPPDEGNEEFAPGDDLFQLDDEVGPGPSGPPPLRFDIADGRLALDGLTTRHDFIVASEDNRQRHLQILEKVAAGAPILFHGNDVQETFSFPRRKRGSPGSGRQYRLSLFGVLPDGSKAHVIVDDAPVFFDTWVPEEADPNQFAMVLSGLLQEHNPIRMELVKGFPLRGFRRTPGTYVRMFFSNLPNRKKAILQVRNQGYDTASDDKSSYANLLARTFGLSLCSWLAVSDYEYRQGGAACGCVPGNRMLPRSEDLGTKSPLAAHVFVVPFSKLKPLVHPLDPDPNVEKTVAETPCLARENMVVMTFDIETHSPEKGLGTPPDPHKPGDVVFMLCATAHWRSSNEPLARVCLATQETAPDSRWQTVICGRGGSAEGASANTTAGQDSLLLAFALLFKAWAPDFVTGFNDGRYDWPFLVEKGYQLGTLTAMESLMSAAPRWKPQSAEDVMKWQYNADRKVKITADKDHLVSYLKFPGYVPIDTRLSYMRLYPKSEKSSLKYFLDSVGLGGKADMPYTKMWKIYERAVEAADLKHSSATPGAAEGGFDPPCVKGTDVPVTAEEMRHVAHYCVIDALRCQQLLVRRNVLGEYREIGNLSFTTFMDCVYRAGGHKVCNLLMAYGHLVKKELGVPVLGSMIAESVEMEGKYPGAFVVPPEKGLEEDLPITGLDFSSLYPSLIRTYNLSTDMAVYSEEDAQKLEAEGEEIYRVESEFGGKPVRGWFVRHKNDASKRGMFPRVLEDLYNKRAGMKKFLKVYEAQIEFYEIMLGEYKKSDGADSFRDFLKKYEELTRQKFSDLQDKEKAALANNKPRKAAGFKKKAKQTLVRANELKKLQLELVEALKADGHDPGEGNLAAERAFSSLLKQRFDAMFEELEFKFVSIDSKQKAVKVFMNTFYGEAGNKRSPIFMLALAIGVTTAGRYNLQLVKKYVESRGFKVKYGDTDSLYLGCPPESYAQIRKEYRAALARIFGLAPEGAEETLEEFTVRDQKFHQELRDAELLYDRRMQAIALAEKEGRPGMDEMRAKAAEAVAAARQRAPPIFLGPKSEEDKDTWLTKLFKQVAEARLGPGETLPPGETPEQAEVYAAYEQYCIRMVEITMDVMATIRDEVNAHLASDNGGKILKMAYEEVLHPVVFTGKKKYFGIAHVNDPNYAIPGPEKIFVRGIDVVKQGQTRLTCEIGLKCMWDATRLHPPGDRTPLITRVEQVLRDTCSSLDNFRAADEGTGQWTVDDFVQSAAWKPAKDNKSVQKFMRRMRVRHKMQLAENEVLVERGEPPLTLDYIEPEPNDRFSFLIVDTGPMFNLRGFSEKTTSKGAKMEYVPVAKAKNMRIDVHYYLNHYVVGLCARLINYYEQFQPGSTVAEENQDKVSQDRAKAYLKKFVNSLNQDNKRLAEKRGYAYKRAYKYAASRACSALSDQLGEGHSLFTGGGLNDFVLSKAVSEMETNARAEAGVVNYELFLNAVEDHSPEEEISYCGRLLSAAKGLADYTIETFEEPVPAWDPTANGGQGDFAKGPQRGLIDRTIEALGINRSPAGRNRLYEVIAQMRPPVRRRGRRGAPSGEHPSQMLQRALTRAEREAFLALDDKKETLQVLAERVQGLVELLVESERAIEHGSSPDTLGALKEDADEGYCEAAMLAGEQALDDFHCTPRESAALQAAHAAWMSLVGVAYRREVDRRLLERLYQMRDRAL